MLEEEIAKQFAKMLTEPIKDEWGNEQVNPITRAINNYAENNKEKILEEIMMKVDIDKMAEIISTKLEGVIKGIYGSSYERESILNQLKDKISEHLAKKIAQDIKL